MNIQTRAAWAANAPLETHRRWQVAVPDGLREASSPPDAASAYDIACITDEFALGHWTGEWRRLLATSQSPEKIYQTPEFFRFLVDSQSTTSDRFELFVIKHRALDNVVGIVPVRISSVALAFKCASLTLATYRPGIVRILGSVPLLPGHPALVPPLLAYLLRAFPACAAVSMQAFPRELQAHLADTTHQQTFIVHGWRACHTIPLPEDWPQYLGQMRAKKRYNLARQYRLLEEAAGPLQLQRVDRSTEVRLLVDSLAVLAPDATLDPVRARDYRVLAANRLLLSYVLKSADAVVAVIGGTRYGDTWHVHQIVYAPQFRHLSAGAVALHAALEDVVTHFTFTSADLGYGTPRHQFASTNVLKTRAHVLVARGTGWQRLLLQTFTRYDTCHAACVRFIKPIAQRWFGK